jgi:hypothetical protein
VLKALTAYVSYLYAQVQLKNNKYPCVESADSIYVPYLYAQVQLLSQECQSLICKTNFVSIVCYAIENQEQHQKVWVYQFHIVSSFVYCIIFQTLVKLYYITIVFLVIETIQPSLASNKQSFEV